MLNKTIFIIFSILFPFYASLLASDIDEIETKQFQKSQERVKALQEKQLKQTDIILDVDVDDNNLTIPIDETPCFKVPVNNIILKGDMSDRFSVNLKHSLEKLNYPQNNPCIGINGIKILQAEIQNSIIREGHVTTRVLLEPQDLSTNTLEFTIIPGRLNQLMLSENASKTFLGIAMPLRENGLLNLRDIEQGLENLSRPPTADASMEILPANKPGYSNILINYYQKRFWRVSFNVDDSGSEATGKIQGGATVSLDSLFGLNDIFYAGITRDLAEYETITLQDKKERGESDSYYWHYSIPWDYWLLSYDYNKYNYDQKVAGMQEIYSYSGVSMNQSISLSRVFYRDSDSKLTMSIKGWERSSQSYIDDAEITVQRRKTAGYELGVSLRKYLTNSVLDVDVSYRRGTGARGALRAPEELFGEGTSRMEIYSMNARFFCPIKVGDIEFSLNSSLRLQHNGTLLTSQDRISIGGRYSVRGFDGEYTLSGDRGAVWRNEIDYNYIANHKIYFGADAGYVGGRSANNLLGNSLVGTFVGLKGIFNYGVNIDYDFFVGMPVEKPKGFSTKSIASGFSLSFSY